MKEDIIKILEKYSSRFNMKIPIDEGELCCNKVLFEQVAEEIEKLCDDKITYTCKKFVGFNDNQINKLHDSMKDDYEFSLMRRSDDKSYGDRYDEKVIKHFSDD